MNLHRGVVVSIFLFMLLMPQLFSFEEGSCQAVSDSEFKIMSFNIRRSSFLDRHDSWDNRSSAVISMICRSSPDVIGLQEVTPHVMEELKVKLQPSYAGYGVGRENGFDSGEHNPIFFNKENLILLNQGTFWLAPSAPAIPTYGWSGKRIVTWAKFQFRESREEFFFFNTHFDNKSEVARRESAMLLLEQMQKDASGFPVILTGDLNATPESESWLTLTSSNPNGAMLFDSRLAGAEPSEVTVSGFDPGNNEFGSVVDYVLVDVSFQVLQYSVLQDTINDRFLSDHRPLLVSVTFNGKDML